ncbi:response regulator [Spongiivirga citrea]|uniref:Response regulator n=1 Tax=Spongiivirga citrea TaxID=1481457 RepID=A0A6M0CHL8_9FLAO|nr:response regulator [Spongiivirga citrea]NER17361.1 response regulator [Spongiivirga citrea]
MKTLSILLIEDDEIESIKFKRVLDTMVIKYNLTLAKNGEEALILVQEENKIPDVIFLDLNMPKMNGTEFLKILKNDTALKYIPAMILTTSNNRADILECYAVGIAGYILKPLRYEDYKEKIQVAVEYWSHNELIKL